jgi:GNAT superfamily N-acetyltransferase
MAERWRVRLITAQDEPFMWEMLYQAIYVPPGASLPERAILQQPDVACYVLGWGRPGDLGLIAVDAESEVPAGAAWLRLWRGAERGYGFVDRRLPELTIAVVPECRGQGFGTVLLQQLLAHAASHYPGISLSVAGQPGQAAL